MAVAETNTSGRALIYAAAVGAAACLAVLLLLNWRLLPTGVPGQWEWPWREAGYVAQAQLLLVLTSYGALLAVVLYALQAERPRRLLVAVTVTLACLTTGAAMLLLESDEPAPAVHLAGSTASAMATGYFGYATAIDGPKTLLRAYSSRPPTLPPMPGRVLTHTPGPVLAFIYGRRVLDFLPGITARIAQHLESQYQLSPAKLRESYRFFVMPSMTEQGLLQAIPLGLLLTLLGCLLPWPAYSLGAGIGDRRSGLVAAFLAALLPSLLSFFPSIDGVAAVLALTVLALWTWALRGSSLWRYVLSGAAMFVAVMWTAGLAGVAVAMLALAWPALRRTWVQRRTAASGSPVGGILLALAVFGGLFLALYLLSGYNLLTNLRVIANQQRLEMRLNQRDYLTWLPMNLYDVALFMGPVLLALVVGSLLCLRSLPEAVRTYAVGAVATFGLIWLSGSTLGEVGRIWLFLMALLAVVPAWPLSRLSGRQTSILLSLAAVLQIGLTLALHCNLALVRP